MQHSTINYVEALLIGGPNDGQRVNIMEGIPQLRMAAPPALEQTLTAPRSDWSEPDVHTYTRSGFGIQHEGKRGMFYLYVHESLPADPIAAVQMLYEGYRQPGKSAMWGHDLNQLRRPGRFA